MFAKQPPKIVSTIKPRKTKRIAHVAMVKPKAASIRIINDAPEVDTIYLIGCIVLPGKTDMRQVSASDICDTFEDIDGVS